MNESYEYHFSGPPMAERYPTPAEQPRKKSRQGLKIIALALCCFLLGGMIGVGGFVLGSAQAAKVPASSSAVFEEPGEAPAIKGEDTVPEREHPVPDPVPANAGAELSPADVYAANVNSTVGITTSITTNFWGYRTQSAASGSGFIITDDGYILTNYHVIEDSDTVTVTLYDGTSYDARIVGYDENNDIAVLKVEAEDLVPVVLGNSDDIRVGDTVIAIGNPLGELTFSLTSGSVSALDRAITMESGITMDLLQTDCAINSGNSGGALFNLHGEVIGITNAKYSGSGSGTSIDNIGFAIPINQVRGIVSSIIENGYIVKPYIGVSVMDVSTEAQNFGLPAGAAVAEVTEGAPADEAGLRANDIITAVNGTEISGSGDLVDVVSEAAVGDELKLSVYRQGENIELTVTVGEQRKEALPEKAKESESFQTMPWPGGSNGQEYNIFPWGFGGF